MPTDKPRVLVTVSETMEKKIQDFRFSLRLNTQSEAVRHLLRVGLAEVMKELESPGGIERLRAELEDDEDDGMSA